MLVCTELQNVSIRSYGFVSDLYIQQRPGLKSVENISETNYSYNVYGGMGRYAAICLAKRCQL
jgi:hypothetical protein